MTIIMVWYFTEGKGPSENLISAVAREISSQMPNHQLSDFEIWVNFQTAKLKIYYLLL